MSVLQIHEKRSMDRMRGEALKLTLSQIKEIDDIISNRFTISLMKISWSMNCIRLTRSRTLSRKSSSSEKVWDQEGMKKDICSSGWRNFYWIRTVLILRRRIASMLSDLLMPWWYMPFPWRCRLRCSQAYLWTMPHISASCHRQIAGLSQRRWRKAWCSLENLCLPWWSLGTFWRIYRRTLLSSCRGWESGRSRCLLQDCIWEGKNHQRRLESHRFKRGRQQSFRNPFRSKYNYFRNSLKQCVQCSFSMI